MPAVNLSCPKCTIENNHTQLQTDGHRIKCPAGHSFEDSAELSQYELKPFAGEAYKPPPPAPPPNATTLSIAIDSRLRDALQARFGGNMEQNIVTILGTIANKGFFIVPAEDSQRFSELLGQPIAAANVLFGAVYNIHEELRSTKEELRLAREASKGNGAASNGGGLQIDFDIETIAKMAEAAAFQGKPLKQHIKDTIEFALEQKWL